jgi:putative ABC transport system permease protein
MSGLLRIAFRNLLRAKRRNALAGATMALGTAALVLGSGLVDGIARQLTRNLVAVQTGHLQVVVRPDDFVPQNSPFDAYGQQQIPSAAALARRIEDEGGAVGVVKAVPYLYGRGQATAGGRSTLASVVGVDAAREEDLRAAHPPLLGRFLPAGDDAATYIAAPMARKLRLEVGDTVSFVVQTPQGAVNSVDAVVCGVFRKGAPWHDNTFYIPLSAAQALFDWPGGATNVKVTLRDGTPTGARRVAPLVERLAAGTPVAQGYRIAVEPYDRAGRFSFSIVEANRAALVILSAFLFLASAIGIVNAMLMSVHARTREIGTLRALGMRRGLVVRLFILEGFVLGLMAAVAGVVLGGAGVVYYGARGIPMNTFTLVWMAGGDRLFPVLEAPSVARAAVAIVLVSTVAALYPAYAASRLEPREALHHV